MKISEYILRIPGLKQIISLLGIDKAIIYTNIGLLWTSISGFFSVIFIVKFLTISQQGYWYTFTSLGALTTFAELGFTTIITQFISHEYAHLEEKNGVLNGNKDRIDRTISLIKFSFKFYLVIISIAFLILSTIGVIFLGELTSDYQILLAWILYSFTGALMLMVTLFGAVLKGFNKVEKVQKVITLAGIASSVTMWIALFLGLGLWSLGFAGLVNILFCLLLYIHSSYDLFNQIAHKKVVGKYRWLKETIPLQWRYAVSWISGYFIFQFMVPVAMFYAGAPTAGKLGLSLVMVRFVQSMASSWGMTKVPQLNIYVAQKTRKNLDELFKNIQWQSLMVYILGSVGLIFTMLIIFPIVNWENRILPIEEIIILFIAEGINLIVFNWAFYLRAHKQEPYMRISLLNATLVALGIWVSYYLFSSTFIALFSFLMVQLIMLIPARRILVNKKKEYEKGEIGY
ncbi:hypothetical protein [uncultured Methanobacterium sp.]|uniref:lipopolysaccharide biosynthesis protein n=1 Tax=uncultured Methanobacterium sp. TaxID=176306 RepID=UPI002AA70A18|nr:hypothetical protein [uncultured Methanobacterium sp.]